MEYKPTYEDLELEISILEKKLKERDNYEKNIERNRVIGSIGHEFNNILMGIQGNLSLIFLDTKKTDLTYEKLKDIEKNINNGVKLTEQLFDFISGKVHENTEAPHNIITTKNLSSNDYFRIKGEIKKYSQQIKVNQSYRSDIYSGYQTYENINKGSATVLLIDDDYMIIDIGKKMLEKIGIEVITASNGFDAISIYEKDYKKINVVILDMIMPEISGIDTYYRLLKINPEIKTLLSSGYRKSNDIDKIISKGNSRFIQKPFNMEKLTLEVGEILKK